NTVPFASGDRFAAPDASAARIVQVIGGAAFQARREGSAIVAVAASEAALDAVVQWAGQAEAEGVRFAPLSAVLRRRAGE
ncbi:MAG: divergent polysaccharide deacetylase family protein, partial [Pseudomonadota bacterium]